MAAQQLAEQKLAEAEERIKIQREDPRPSEADHRPTSTFQHNDSCELVSQAIYLRKTYVTRTSGELI